MTGTSSRQLLLSLNQEHQKEVFLKLPCPPRPPPPKKHCGCSEILSDQHVTIHLLLQAPDRHVLQALAQLGGVFRCLFS